MVKQAAKGISKLSQCCSDSFVPCDHRVLEITRDYWSLLVTPLPTSKIDPAVGCLLLSTLLPLGSELTESLSSQDKLLPVFRDYFDTIVLLAGTNREDGHLVLVKAVERWLPDCIQLLKRKEAEQKEGELKEGRMKEGEGKGKLSREKEKAAVPAGSLLKYLSHLTSAVQFITNMVKSTEKRNLASDNDSLVQVFAMVCEFSILNTECTTPVSSFSFLCPPPPPIILSLSQFWAAFCPVPITLFPSPPSPYHSLPSDPLTGFRHGVGGGGDYCNGSSH